MLRIRLYVNSDYEAVKQNLLDGKLFDKVWDSRESLQRKIDNNPHAIFVAELNGAVIGNVYIVEDGWTAFLFHLAVRKKFRNKGIGSTLMQAAETHMTKRGIKEVSLFLDRKNKRLLNWYKKQRYYSAGNYNWLYKKLK